MSSTRHDLSKLARLVAYRKMDRREFLSQALKAGVLATAASIFLTACRRPPVAEVAPEEPTPSFDQQ
ncbi:hypothetical protein, partial [Candidatus Hakubella thermalkaliphila]